VNITRRSALGLGVVALGRPSLSPTSRIRVRQRVVWSGRGKLKLACGALITKAPGGDLLCAWLSGADQEPASDNCMLLARSKDNGRTWSEPTQWISPENGMAALATALYSTPHGRMVAFGAHWPSEKGYTELYFFRIESGDAGRTWSKREPIVVHGNHAILHHPIRLANGEMLFPTSIFDRRPKPLIGPVERLAFAANEEEALAIPAAPGERSGGKFSHYLHGCASFISSDAGATRLVEHGRISNRPLGLLEPYCIQLREGRVAMLMRAEWGGFL